MKSNDRLDGQCEKACAEEHGSPDALQQEISRLRDALATERSQKEFLLSAIDALPNPIFIKDQQGNFVFFNQTYAQFFGMEQQKFIGKSVLSLPFLPAEDRKRYQVEDLQLIEHSSLLHYEVDYTSASGELCPSFYWSRGFASPKTGAKGLVGEIVSIAKEKALEKQLMLNIQELEKANQTIAAASKIDTLTGVFNRRFLAEQEKLFMAGTIEKTASICFLMLDLDHFKRVNDNFGHHAGDEVLSHFAKILKGSCREHDLPIRYGGEEFLILLYDVDLSVAQKIAERIRARCEQELFLPDGTTNTVSIGISQHHPGESLNDCIAHADEALYQAKETGRNKVVTEVCLRGSET